MRWKDCSDTSTIVAKSLLSQGWRRHPGKADRSTANRACLKQATRDCDHPKNGSWLALDLTRIVHCHGHDRTIFLIPPFTLRVNNRRLKTKAPQGVSLDSFAGPVRVEWDTEAALTPLGQLPFFIDFLKAAGLFDAFVADCPLHYTSPNAPKKRDVLGTAMLSMLSGHKRYAHIAALRGDGVLPELLGMNKIVSEDAVRRAFAAIDEEEGAAWLRRHLDYCMAPLLAEPWILDIDTTVKPLYGHQEGAVVGYNPKKPGRPSHCYHTYSMAGAAGPRCRCCRRQRAHVQTLRARPVGVARSDAARSVAGSVARRLRLRQRADHARSRAARLGLFVQAAADRQCQAHDRTSVRAKRMGERRSRLASQGERIAARGLEPAAPRDRVAAAREGRLGDVLKRDAGAATRSPSSRSARTPKSTNIRFSSLRSTRSSEFRPAVSRSRRQREYFRRVEEPMGLGRLRHAGPCSLPAGRAPRRAVLRLVEHLRSSGRAGPAYGGDHQPAIVFACHRHADAACEANDDHRDEFARQGDSRREGASRCRHFSTRTCKKCGAVDAPATLAANPLASLPSFP